MALKTYAAESVVNRPFPSSVRVTVKHNSSFTFAGAFFDCCYIVTCFFGEKAVNKLFIHTKLHKCDKQADNNKNNGCKRENKKQCDSRKYKRDCKINPTEKRARIFLKRFNLCSFAAAIIFQNISHIFTCLKFAL